MLYLHAENKGKVNAAVDDIQLKISSEKTHALTLLSID